MTYSGFQSFTSPRDTFVTQSTQPAINTQDSLSQVAQALSIIEPQLQKFIVSKITDIKETEVAEATAEGKKAGQNYTAQEKLLYPEQIDLETTQGQIAQKLNQLTKAGNEAESKELRANNPWYKQAFYKAKSETLGKNLSATWLKDLKEYRVVDPQDGQEKSLAAFPFSSPQVQEYISTRRNARVEQLDMPEFYVRRYFLPALETGIEGFQAEHQKLRTNLKLDKLEKINQLGLEEIISTYLIDETKSKEFIKQELKLWTDNLRSYYVGKDFTEQMGKYTDYIMNYALSIASEKGAGANRFNDARQFLNDFTSLFPTYSLGTRKVKNADGTITLKTVENRKNSITNTKDFLKKINTAKASIDKLENRFLDYKDKIQPEIDIQKARDLLINSEAPLSQEDVNEGITTLQAKREKNQQELKKLISSDPKVAKFIKDNQNVITSKNKERQILFTERVANGEIRNEQFGIAHINLIYEQSLKTPQDTEWKIKSLNSIRKDVAENRKVAEELSSDVIARFNKRYINRKELSAPTLDKIESITEQLPRDINEFYTTKKQFNNEVNADGVQVIRYPTEDELRDFVEAKEQAANNILNGIRQVEAGEGTKKNPQFRTATQLQLDEIVDNRQQNRSVLLTARQLKADAPFVDGKQSKPTLEDVAEQYSYGEPITVDGIMGGFFLPNGDFDEEQKEELRVLLNYVQISDEQIKQFGLVDKGVLSTDRLNEYESQKIITNIDEQSNQEDNKTEEESSVTNETNNNTTTTTDRVENENENEIKNINDRQDIIDPANLNKASLNTIGNIANNVINTLTGTQSADAGTLENKPKTSTEDKSVRYKTSLSNKKIINATDVGVKTKKEEPNGVKLQEHNFPIFYKLAKEAGHKFPELTAAQAMEETGNGDSPSGRNNYLGLKANEFQIRRGQSSLLDTEEDFGKGNVPVKDNFTDYDDMRDQFIQYREEWQEPFRGRKGIVSVDTPEEALDLMLSDPQDMYATGKGYKQRILQIIEEAKQDPPLF